MKAHPLLLAVTLAGGLAGPSVAQTELGRHAYSGLHMHVAAAEGTAWMLECRFRPVKVNTRWFNRLRRESEGRRAERLPHDNGRCRLTRTQGGGPIGLAIVKDGVAHAAGTNDPATPAAVQVF